MQPLNPDLARGGHGPQMLPEVRFHEGLVDSPNSSAEASASSYSSLASSLSNFAAATPKRSGGGGGGGPATTASFRNHHSNDAANVVAAPLAVDSHRTELQNNSATVNVNSVAPSLSSRRTTTTSTVAATTSLPPSPMRRPLQPASSFISTTDVKHLGTESVKFVGEDGGAAGGERPRGPRNGGGSGSHGSGRPGSGGPIRLLSGMQGTVLPENHGGLPKMGHTAVSYQQAVYVFGGVNGKGQYSNHVFCHEKRNLAWHEIRGVGVVPRGRANHAAVLVDSKIYVFGGHRQLEVFDDLFAYDITTSRWEKISYEQSQGPGGVFLHCMLHLPSSESLFVLGGVHHREQNSYLGHLFDIRNRVWSGVPPPPSVNPQHLQLVSAAYHEHSNSVVVLGLAEDDSGQLLPPQASVPYVYIFHPQSFAWRRVETPTAPESPLPFRVEALWEHFLHFLITSGGGLYDPVLQDWMFPFPLSPSPGAAATAAAAATSGNGSGNRKSIQSPLTPPPPPANKLGFLVLSLRDMSWSLVLCKFPRKLLAEVKTYNVAERQKVERHIARAGGVGGAALLAAAVSHRSSTSTRHSRNESGVLNLSGLSRAAGGYNGNGGGSNGGGGGGVFGQRPQRRNLSMSSSAGVTWGHEDNSSEVSGTTANSLHRGSGGSMLSAGGGGGGAGSGGVVDRYRRLVNFQDAPEFTRKFVLVAVREAPMKNGKLRPMQYMVLHGGLVEPTDYTMLAFKPRLTRIDALAATKQSGQLAGLVRTASYRTTRSTRNTTTGNGDGDEEDDEDDNETGRKSFSPTVDTESFSELFSAANGGTGNGQRNFSDVSGTSYLSMDDGDAFSQTFGNSVSDENLGPPLGDFDDEAASQHGSSSLLPTLPAMRSVAGGGGGRHRFAMQYTAENALHTESLLPYANIPVAVLSTAQDVHKWSKNYYADQRRWLADKLKDALSEDRKLRRLRRAANARSGRPTSGGGGGGSGARSSRASAMSDDLSVGDTDSLMESLYLLESMTNLPRGGRNGEKKSSTLQAFEDQLSMEAAAAAVENKEAPQRRVQDFFEERHLEPFVAEDVAQLPHLGFNASASSDDRGKGKKGGNKKKQNGPAEATKTKAAAAASSVKAVPAPPANTKKKKGLKTTPVAASSQHAPAASTISGAPLPTSFVPIVGQSTAASVGFERFTMKPKRRLASERHSSNAFPGGGGGGAGGDYGHGDVARSVSQLLLQNGLDRFRADDDTIETRKRKARLRWRFLRALVCTGAASYLMYVASQAQSKMRGVTVSSTPGLVLAPELHLVGPSQAYKVPSKPVPYNVSNTAGALPAPQSVSSARFTQVTSSGMVVYRSLR